MPVIAPPATTTAAPETEMVTTSRIACNGGQGALGHPRVWLQIAEDKGWVECPYCDKKFVLQQD